MSASHSEKKDDEQKAETIFSFTMKQKIPSYLIAMAVGNIVSADIGPRSKVWTEPRFCCTLCTFYFTFLNEFLSVKSKKPKRSFKMSLSPLLVLQKNCLVLICGIRFDNYSVARRFSVNICCEIWL